MSMRVTSANGKALIAGFESNELRAYPDPESELGQACTHLGLKLSEYRQVPRWQLLNPDPVSIGRGHTGKSIRLGDVWTQETVDSVFNVDISCAEFFTVGLELSQNQFDAIVSLIFNIGGAAFTDSTLRRLLLAKDYVGASAEFPKWCHSGGRVVSGLVERRAKERALFDTPDASTIQAA